MTGKRSSKSREVAVTPLGPTNVDRMAGLVKALMQIVPGFGSVAAEIFGLVIPNQRIDRIEAFLLDLARRLPPDEDNLRTMLTEPEDVDLFEEGVIHAGRALSQERKEYIASIVETGITGDQATKIRSKRMLRLLELLDDEQIILLAGHQFEIARTLEFSNRHGNVKAGPFVSLGAPKRDKDAMLSRKLALHQLTQLGLLEETIIFEGDGKTPRLAGGRPDVRGHDITPMGTLLLEAIGIIRVEDLGAGRNNIHFVGASHVKGGPV